MTVDEELNALESNLRRLKIEYEIYFNNPSKRPPADTEWRVSNVIRKLSDGYSEGQRMNFAQRYRYNELTQRYALLSDLWRKKMRIREEGYRRPQDALLSVQGVRVFEDKATPGHHATLHPFTVECSEVGSEREKVQKLFDALVEAKKKAGEDVSKSGSLESFEKFVQSKTDQIRKQYGCHAVEYSVEMDGGQVRLKAKAKV
ncbi:MAG TPA: MXAN_5187 C-terminal domain-containing protein [Terriglobales bacterium]|nr:MXAN_5187 C-terminal domain-containing protein [Terriglobales bacterium]